MASTSFLERKTKLNLQRQISKYISSIYFFSLLRLLLLLRLFLMRGYSLRTYGFCFEFLDIFSTFTYGFACIVFNSAFGALISFDMSVLTASNLPLASSIFFFRNSNSSLRCSISLIG